MVCPPVFFLLSLSLFQKRLTDDDLFPPVVLICLPFWPTRIFYYMARLKQALSLLARRVLSSIRTEKRDWDSPLALLSSDEGTSDALQMGSLDAVMGQWSQWVD